MNKKIRAAHNTEGIINGLVMVFAKSCTPAALRRLAELKYHPEYSGLPGCFVE